MFKIASNVLNIKENILIYILKQYFFYKKLYLFSQPAGIFNVPSWANFPAGNPVGLKGAPILAMKQYVTDPINNAECFEGQY